jgi:HTH-type transcriptional regulator / antitoxin HigA
MRIIRDKEMYQAALAEISVLMDLNPEFGTPEADRLEVLTLLVETYEREHFPSQLPNPVEAIKFRMEQQNLKQGDLIPYIGSKSKVSEVLSGKRPLSLSMIRALHTGLAIPAKALLQERKDAEGNDTEIEWDRFPLKEMIARGWIKTNLTEVIKNSEECLRQFFATVGGPTEVVAMYKKTNFIRSGREMDRYALAAWTARVMTLALNNPPKVAFDPDTLNLDFMREIVRLSWADTGPLLAQEFLRNHGISLIIEPQLPRTYLDGAAIMIIENNPIIGLSLRHDRIDSFWFSLVHELAHIVLHRGQGINQFYDDLENKENEDPKEKEADALAVEALIPEQIWKTSPARVLKSPQAVQQLASKLRIHPAIVAGRVRREYNAYNLMNNVIGHGKVRILFKDVNWSEK